MSDEERRAAVREQLRTVEEELKELRESAADLRRAVGSRSGGADDPEDTAVVIAEAEEQEALIDVLESRRTLLLERLGSQ